MVNTTDWVKVVSLTSDSRYFQPGQIICMDFGGKRVKAKVLQVDPLKVQGVQEE